MEFLQTRHTVVGSAGSVDDAQHLVAVRHIGVGKNYALESAPVHTGIFGRDDRRIKLYRRILDHILGDSGRTLFRKPFVESSRTLRRRTTHDTDRTDFERRVALDALKLYKKRVESLGVALIFRQKIDLRLVEVYAYAHSVHPTAFRLYADRYSVVGTRLRCGRIKFALFGVLCPCR